MATVVQTLTAARAEYLMACQVDGKTRRTLGLYSDVTGRFCDFTGDKSLEDVAPGDIRSYLANLDLSLVSINIHCRVLRAFFNFQVRSGYLDQSPMTSVQTPKVPQIYPYVLSEEEVAKLIKAARPNRRDYAIMLLLLDTGIRASELCALTVDDISLAIRNARVFGKGAKERTVYFSQITAKALAAYLTERKAQEYENALFVNQRGEPLTTSGLLQLTKRLGKRAGLEGKRVSPHTLRHTFATLYVKEGGDAHSLQRMLGHTTTKMAEVYVNLVGRDLAEAHRRYSPVGRLERQRRA